MQWSAVPRQAQLPPDAGSNAALTERARLICCLRFCLAVLLAGPASCLGDRQGVRTGDHPGTDAPTGDGCGEWGRGDAALQSCGKGQHGR